MSFLKDVFGQLEVFRHQRSNVLTLLASCLHPHTTLPGHNLSRQGSAADRLWILQAGKQCTKAPIVLNSFSHGIIVGTRPTDVTSTGDVLASCVHPDIPLPGHKSSWQVSIAKLPVDPPVRQDFQCLWCLIYLSFVRSSRMAPLGQAEHPMDCMSMSAISKCRSLCTLLMPISSLCICSTGRVDRDRLTC